MALKIFEEKTFTVEIVYRKMFAIAASFNNECPWLVTIHHKTSTVVGQGTTKVFPLECFVVHIWHGVLSFSVDKLHFNFCDPHVRM